MDVSHNREKVWRALETLLAKDKAKTTINRISELGLLEMTRKRTRESLNRTMHEMCFYCDGTGQIQSRTTIAYEILRQIRPRTRDAVRLLGARQRAPRGRGPDAGRRKGRRGRSREALHAPHRVQPAPRISHRAIRLAGQVSSPRALARAVAHSSEPSRARAIELERSLVRAAHLTGGRTAPPIPVANLPPAVRRTTRRRPGCVSVRS